MLKPCQYRTVNEGGQLICAKIVQGDREVSEEICSACPVAAINCQHLRFSLTKNEQAQIVVRYANGRQEVWDREAPGVRFQRVACAALCIPLDGVSVCQQCSLRRPAVVAGAQMAVLPAAEPQTAAPAAARS